MKIIQVIGRLGNGGAEKLVVELSNELVIKHEITIISLKKEGGWENPSERIDRKVKYLELKRIKGIEFKILVKLFQILRKQKPNIVHIHLNLQFYYFLLIIPFFPGIEFVFTIHSSFKVYRNFFTKLSKYPFGNRISFVCLSPGIYADFKKYFPKYKFSMIENGIKYQDSKPDNKIQQKIMRIRDDFKTVFLFVGRLAYAKNIPLLLDIFSSPRLNHIKLLIIGDGDTTMKKMVQDAVTKTFGRIEYLGKQEKVLDYMQNVDAFVLTSHYEGMPVSLIEALSAGLPVISTPVGGIPDMIVDGENGFLSDTVSKEGMTKAINDFLQLDENQILLMKKKNQALFQKRFSMEVCAANHEKLYQQLVNNG